MAPKAPKVVSTINVVNLDDTDNESIAQGEQHQNALLHSWIQHDHADFHKFSDEDATRIRTKLLEWYRQNRRKLPWRGDPPPWQGSTVDFGKGKKIPKKTAKQQQPTISQFFAKAKTTTSSKQPPIIDDDDDTTTTDSQLQVLHHQYPVSAYGIWVSEIMCQQTRVEAVVLKWCAWMTAFPTVQDLARARPEQVNALWAGLGFYRRARLLHRAAQHVVEELEGEIPTTVEALQRQLPGVGRYTASAIASIAFGVTVPVVDGNVCRVLSRLRGIAQCIKAAPLKDAHGWELAQQIVEAGDGKNAGDVNQALMELGATYCAPSGTGCDPNDPLREFYMSVQLGEEIAGYVERESTNELLNMARGIGKTRCSLCEATGVERVLQTIITQQQASMSNGVLFVNDTVCVDEARRCGHGAFPLPPEKTSKREEVLAVAALSCWIGRDNEDDVEAWLLVRRPNTGLLAGQWEFPASICWTSADNPAAKAKNEKRKNLPETKIPVVSKTIRRKALKKHLDSLCTCSGQNTGQPRNFGANLKQVSLSHVGDAPIEHIFSHVRHTMWLEHAVVKSNAELSWEDSCGREVRWMTLADMKEVGVTSGVKKILKAVEKHVSVGSNPPTATRRAAKEDTVKRPRIKR